MPQALIQTSALPRAITTRSSSSSSGTASRAGKCKLRDIWRLVNGGLYLLDKTVILTGKFGIQLDTGGIQSPLIRQGRCAGCAAGEFVVSLYFSFFLYLFFFFNE